MLAVARHFLCVLIIIMCIGVFQAELLLQRQPEFVDDSLATFDAWLRECPPPPSKWYGSPEAVEEEKAPEGFLPILSLAELPKGTRKLAELPDGSGQEVLLLWYRGSVLCIENRSPAEGAYSEGLLKSKFTQDYGIVCQSTGSVFSLRDGSVLEWYPNNPVLAQLTPKSTARDMEIFPVALAGGAVCVDPSAGSLRSRGITYSIKTMKGGFGTSAEDNNVFGVEPAMYLEGTEPGTAVAEEDGGAGAGKLNPVVVISSTLAVAIVAVAGTATALYYESLPALAAIWVSLFSGVAYLVVGYLKEQGDI